MFYKTVSAIREPIITSNIDAGGGRHLAATGYEAIFTCTTAESTFLEWKSLTILNEGMLRFTINDDIGRSKYSMNFKATLISKSTISGREGNLTSTLTFEVVEQYSELVIVCAAGNYATNATLYLLGMCIY